MGKLSNFDVNNHVPANRSCLSTLLISIMYMPHSVEINKLPKQTGKVIHKASVSGDRKTSFGFWQKQKAIFFFSVGLNQNPFPMQSYFVFQLKNKKFGKLNRSDNGSSMRIENSVTWDNFGITGLALTTIKDSYILWFFGCPNL